MAVAPKTKKQANNASDQTRTRACLQTNRSGRDSCSSARRIVMQAAWQMRQSSCLSGLVGGSQQGGGRLRLKCDGTCAETRVRLSARQTSSFNPLNPELNPICYLLALLGAHHFLYVSRIRVKLLTFRRLMSCIYMEHLFLMFLDHTQRRSTVGRTPLDE